MVQSYGRRGQAEHDHSGSESGGSQLSPDVLDTGSVNLDSFTPDYPMVTISGTEETSNQTTTSTTYTAVLETHGSARLELPSNYTLYARFVCRLENDTAGETTFARPVTLNDSLDAVRLNELEVSYTGTGGELVSSGWQEITTLSVPVNTTYFRIEAKVSGGTGTLLYKSQGIDFAGVVSE